MIGLVSSPNHEGDPPWTSRTCSRSSAEPEGGVDPAKLISGVQDVFASQGGVDGLLAKLRAGGLGGHVDSWVSTGTNQPVEPAQLGAALGPDTVNQLSSKTGLSIQTLLPMLAAFLPMIINHLTPNGQAPKPGEPANQPDLGGLLGGLLGGGGLGGILGGSAEARSIGPSPLRDGLHRRMSMPDDGRPSGVASLARARHDPPMDRDRRRSAAARIDRHAPHRVASSG